MPRTGGGQAELAYVHWYSSARHDDCTRLLAMPRLELCQQERRQPGGGLAPQDYTDVIPVSAILRPALLQVDPSNHSKSFYNPYV